MCTARQGEPGQGTGLSKRRKPRLIVGRGGPRTSQTISACITSRLPAPTTVSDRESTEKFHHQTQKRPGASPLPHPHPTTEASRGRTTKTRRLWGWDGRPQFGGERPNKGEVSVLEQRTGDRMEGKRKKIKNPAMATKSPLGRPQKMEAESLNTNKINK